MDQETFASDFEAIRPALMSFILRMTIHVEETEDIIQDAYLKATEKLETFRGESSLKTWVFAIASNLAKDHLRAKKRWPENVTDICKEAAMTNPTFFQEAMTIRQTSAQGAFEISEHIAFCFTCVSKSLPLEQQLVILLKEVYGFKSSEITTLMSTTDAMVKYYLREARGRMTKVFDHRCSLINQEGVCHQCTELNGIFNPKQKTQEALAKIAMARDADKKSKEELFDLRMKVLQDIDPFMSNAAELQLHHLSHNRKVMEKYLEEKS